VNGEKHENLLVDFYRLGIDNIYAISAQHGLGINELLSAVTELFPSLKEKKQSDDTQIKIAIVGKPNVGKSSLINLISGKNRTIANATPGTTRDAIDLPLKVHGKHYLLIDTAGIRKKNKISLTLEKYSVIQALKSINRCNVALVLIDAEEGITEQDAKIAGLAYERGKACIIVVNKWDKIKKDNAIVGKYVEEIKETLKFMDFAPIIFISAVTGQRAPKIFNIINDIYNQYTKRVDTSALNTLLENITRKNPLPLYQNKRVRIFYATQVDIKPPSFVFFVSAVKGIHFSYRRFLTNQIREKFDFNVVPIKIIFRKKR
jgi:GTP-binding protein